MTTSCPSGPLTTDRKRRGEDEYSLTLNKNNIGYTQNGNEFYINAKLYPPISVPDDVNPYLTLKGASVKTTMWNLHQHPNVYTKPFIILVELSEDGYNITPNLRYAYFKGYFDSNRLYSYGSSDNADTYANAIASKEMDGADRYYLYVPNFDAYVNTHFPPPMTPPPLVSPTVSVSPGAQLLTPLAERYPTYDSALALIQKLEALGYYGESNKKEIDQANNVNYWAKDRRMIRNVTFSLNDVNQLTEVSFDVMTHIIFRTQVFAGPITTANFLNNYGEMVLSGTTTSEFASQLQYVRSRNLTIHYAKSVQVYFPPGMAEIFGFRDNPIPHVERNCDPIICPHTYGPAPNANFTDDYLFDPFWYSKDDTMFNINDINIPRGSIYRTRFSCTSSDPGLPLHFCSQLKISLENNRENAYASRLNQLEKSEIFTTVDIPSSAVNTRIRTELQDYLPLKISSEKTIQNLNFKVMHFNSENWNADVFSTIVLDFELYFSLYV